MKRIWLSMVLGMALLAGGADAKEPDRITVGAVPSLPGAPLYIAIDKGYFKEYGLSVEAQPVGSSGDLAAMLASGRLQAISGAPSVGLFNTVDKGLPLEIIMSGARSPYNQAIMLRSELKGVVNTPADLKGRTIATNNRGSVTMYQISKVLEAGGLSLKDVTVKFMPFSQMPVALDTGAVDAAMMISPSIEVAEEKKFAFRWINPDDVIKVKPTDIALMQINTDWAAANPDAAYKFVLALMRARRDYCDAYHFGPNRQEVVRMMARYTKINDEKFIDRISWTAIDPDGRVAERSLMAIQDFFLEQGLIARKHAFSKMVNTSLIERAAEELGPYKPARDDGREGCR
ncbi:MAG: ABC transporter substrate-binding protein [Pigmentiphaga sp.]|uniref:ABC transporter substrate-binding protein n=1 Tax=Pigmentiphaga sp. TaxID=1977564 RepID=UPI0029BA074F|nr:ABC transporter substrate-binding protein [Pigmentiphaga sp.]MDX3905829.1 ABC transporter substrate-binding protein [Pigmentiphaga sp.]